ncbi:hypothetical protein ACO0LM_17415 [Undibacterium sp. Di26W]|uniref:hypothetical protein n=1 Tax=Undibacterium sp. Di26W TaxID=3413035 RepID=UPI003BF29F5B
MLLSLVSARGASPHASHYAGLAAAIAQRRAQMGRNVLLLTQCMPDKQANQYKRPTENRTWQAREMKISATIRTVHSDALMAELATARQTGYDVIADLQQAHTDVALHLLAESHMLVFYLQTALWDRDQQTRMMKCIRTAREKNHSLPLLFILDDINSKTGQDLVNKLARQLHDIRFLLANTSPDLTLSSIYKSIFLPAAIPSA